MDLKEFFAENPSCAIAFSGGVDSSFLLYISSRYAKKVKAYYVKSPFQPQFEYEDALKFASGFGVELEVIKIDVLKNVLVSSNPADRCYHCKTAIFSKIIEKAAKDGFDTILDGTNASDDAGDRPGMKALQELKVRSPLRECGITKAQVRELSKEEGLYIWNKPSYACLATRVKTGEEITKDKLKKIEKAENYLRRFGFTDFRVRVSDNVAKLEINKNEMYIFDDVKEILFKELKKSFDSVIPEPEVRQ